MEASTAEILARVQFFFTVSFHIIFPSLTIGLAAYLAVLNGLWLRTRREVYFNLFEFWKKIFAVAFAMGVVSGVVMSYQFGTNWAVFSDRAGPVIGPLMGYEVLTAFFLEAGFLGVMLFGRNKVGEGAHMLATAMVAIGTVGSAFWILSVNSWMQTPAGYEIAANGQFVPTDWFHVIFNPSFPYRLAHMVLAAFLTTAFVVGAVGAYHLLRDRSDSAARVMFSMAMWMAAIVTPAQILAGDLHGLNTLEHQPVKIMAMEGYFDSYPEGYAPFTVIGWPNQTEGKMEYALELPGLGSLILHHSLDAPVRGLNEVPLSQQPPVGIVFFSFRVMVAIGFLMLAVGLWSLWSRWRGTLYDNVGLQRSVIWMGPSGFIAIIAGWIVTEVGRQPYTVYGLLTTRESLSPVEAPAIAASLLAFFVVYMFVFGAGTWYILRMMRRGVGASKEHSGAPIRTAGIGALAGKS